MRAAVAPFLTLCAAPLMAACGPVSDARAMEICADRADLAAGPRGNLRIGAGSGGVTTGLSIEIGSDYLMGRDPDAVYAACFEDLTGRRPA